MASEEWIKTLEDGRKVKFIYQELPGDGAFITAQIARNEVVYSIILTKARNPLSREDVESRFSGELTRISMVSVCMNENKLNKLAELLRELEETLLSLQDTENAEDRRLLVSKISRLFEEIERYPTAFGMLDTIRKPLA
jgi:hypothetical protein